METKLLYRMTFLVILAQYTYGIRNVIGHFPKHHSRPGGARPTNSRTTISGLDLTNRLGNILTERELTAIIPLLSRNTWFPIKPKPNKQGLKGKASHRGKKKLQSHKSHKQIGQVEKHTIEKLFRVQHLEDRINVDKSLAGKHTTTPTYGNHRVWQKDRGVGKLSHHAAPRDKVHEKKHHSQPHEEERQSHHIIVTSKAFVNNKLSVLTTPSTVRPPVNRRHHKHYTGDLVAAANRIEENTVRRLMSGSSNKPDDFDDFKHTTTQSTQDLRGCEGEQLKTSDKSNDNETYWQSVDFWRRKLTERLAQTGNCDCENGGHCILKVACSCPREYYGVRCQHRLHHHSCGEIKHGDWTRNGCNLCRCEDGNMLCITSDITSCEDSYGEQEEILQSETIRSDQLDSYISKVKEDPISGQRAYDEEDNQQNVDILAEYEIIPLPSSAICSNVNIMIMSSTLILSSILVTM